MKRVVFFADILGFGVMSRGPEARRAVDALTDVYTLLSEKDAVASHLRQPVWEQQFALSDSIFLVASELVNACSEAARFFFNLAFYNSDPVVTLPVLLRGGIAMGTARVIPGIFQTTCAENLVGDAVVAAVTLERSSLKGPRLFVADDVADLLETTALAAGPGWIVDRSAGQPAELLWILPPDKAAVNPTFIGDVCAAAVRWFHQHSGDSGVLPHYLGYLDLVTRSVLRLRQHVPAVAKSVIEKARLEGVREKLQELSVSGDVRGVEVLDRLKQLL